MPSRLTHAISTVHGSHREHSDSVLACQGPTAGSHPLRERDVIATVIQYIGGCSYPNVPDAASVSTPACLFRVAYRLTSQLEFEPDSLDIMQANLYGKHTVGMEDWRRFQRIFHGRVVRSDEAYAHRC